MERDADYPTLGGDRSRLTVVKPNLSARALEVSTSSGARGPRVGGSRGEDALARALEMGPDVPTPDQLRPYTAASPQEKLRRALVVLVEARRLFRARHGNLLECLIAAGDGSPQGWWARQIVQGAVGDRDLLAFCTGPRVRRADIYRLLDDCISKCRGHQGGWHVRAAPSAPRPELGMDEFERLRRGVGRRGWKPTVIGGEG